MADKVKNNPYKNESYEPNFDRVANEVLIDLKQNKWGDNSERWFLRVEKIWKGRYSLESYRHKTEFIILEKPVRDISRIKQKWDNDNDISTDFVYEIKITWMNWNKRMLCRSEKDVIIAANFINFAKNEIDKNWKKMRTVKRNWYEIWPFEESFAATWAWKSIIYHNSSFTSWRRVFLSWFNNIFENSTDSYNFGHTDFSDWDVWSIVSEPSTMNPLSDFLNCLYKNRVEYETKKSEIKTETWIKLSDAKKVIDDQRSEIA